MEAREIVKKILNIASLVSSKDRKIEENSTMTTKSDHIYTLPLLPLETI